jgi:hypothetical protein
MLPFRYFTEILLLTIFSTVDFNRCFSALKHCSVVCSFVVPSCLVFSVIIRSKIYRTPHCRSRISIFTINCYVWSTVICHAVVSRFVRHFLQKVCFNFHCLIVVATEMKPRKSHHRQIASGADRGHSHFEDKILGSSVLWI